MAYYITTYNGIDLQATCGVVTPRVSGVHDLPDLEIKTLKLPGSSVPHLTVLREGMRTIQFGAVVEGTSHTDLVTKLGLLKTHLRASYDFQELIVADRPAQQIMALCTGFPVDVDSLPGDMTVLELRLPFLCYPYWEDSAAVSAKIAATFLSFRQATFEHTALDGWHSLTGGLPTLETSGAYAGDYCMKVVAVGGGDTGAKTPEAGIVGITAGNDYSLQMYLKGAAGAETVTAAIRFFKADGSYISEATGNFTLTTAWAQYKIEGAAAPALATKASVQIRDAHGSTFYVDQVCLEEAAACGVFIFPADANTTIDNGGQLTCYPVYTCTVIDTMATGLAFTVSGRTFTYEGALAIADSLIVDTDQQDPRVTLNGSLDMANVDIDSAFPPLPIGPTSVLLSDSSKFYMTMAYRPRYR